MNRQKTKAFLALLHVPEHLVGRPVRDIHRVLADPLNRTLEKLAEEAHRMINNPDASLDVIIMQLDAERKAERDRRAIR